MKSSTVDLLILQVWHLRNDVDSEMAYCAFNELIVRAGKLARAMLQGEKYGMQAIDVAVLALDYHEDKLSISHEVTLRPSTVQLLKGEIERGRSKFPKNDLMLPALLEEIGELAEAVKNENKEEAAKEALQVACIAVRIAEEGDTTFDNASEESKQK